MSETSRNVTPQSAFPNDRPWTIDRVLTWVSEHFRSRGIESPRLEAELLLARVLQTSRVRLVIERGRVLTPDELAGYREIVRRRRQHEPTAYLLGEKEFFGRVFQVDRRVLIPRPDTETLVEVALRHSRGQWLHGRMLDLGTGSGNLALCFAKERPTWQVDAVDLSSDAIHVARDNAVRLGALWNVRFLQGDLFEPVRELGAVYDLVVANPPYIPTAEIPRLPPHIHCHEPHIALDGGRDGLDVVRRIVRDAPSHLVSGGLLAIETGSDQCKETAALFEGHGFVRVTVDADLGQRPRVVSGVTP